jgi:uncharacterized membrane protein
MINKQIPDPGKKLTLLLTFTSLVAIALVLYREHVTAHATYMFLLWNLFLAWIPFLISSYMHYTGTVKKHWIVNAGLLLTWLIFFPNAPYILTDLVHLKPRHDIAYWYDFLILLFFSFNSLFLGFASLIQVKRMADYFLSPLLSHAGVLLILVLTSFGIYLGRFERYNSWDIIVNPVNLVKDIYSLLLNIHHERQVVYVVFFLALFLIINYFTLILIQQQISFNKEEKK